MIFKAKKVENEAPEYCDWCGMPLKNCLWMNVKNKKKKIDVNMHVSMSGKNDCLSEFMETQNE